jgi:Myb-like DNA-binding domain
VGNGAKVGKWTKEMDTKLQKLYETYRSNWALIAKYIPGKTAKTIRE